MGASQANGSYNPLNWDLNSIDTWGGMLGGAVIGGMSFGIGTAVQGATAGLLAANGVNGGLLGGAITGFASGVAVGGFNEGFMSILPGGNGDFIGSMLNGIWMGGLTGLGLGAVSGYLTTPKGFNRFNGNHLSQTTLEAPTAGIKPMVTLNKGIDNLTLRGLEVTEVSSDLSLAQEHIFVKGIDGELRIAARGSTKLLSQFTKSTIDDATAYAMRTQNNIDHIFAAKHKLGPLVNKLGGQRNTINAALNAGNGRFPTSGFFRMQVNVGGQNVWIKGAVHNGMPKLGTMWIP